MPENSDYYWEDYGSWYKKGYSDTLKWFVFDDRKMYRPKEEVSVKGYIRKITAGKLGDVEGLGDAAAGVTWSVKDPRNNEIASGKTDQDQGPGGTLLPHAACLADCEAGPHPS